jgi:transcriptional regulator with XRE-family HTH domain
MIIGKRLRSAREQLKLSQGEIEKRSGLLRSYISRVENGYTVPALETLEKLARALEVPLHQLLYEGEEPPQAPPPARQAPSETHLWGSSRKDARYLRELRHLLAQVEEPDRRLLLLLVRKLAKKKSRK